MSREDAWQILEQCPDAEWRLLFCLLRFGGMRCPSEPLAIRVQDIDFARHRIKLDSPKTGARELPIFSELRPHLDAVWERLPEGTPGGAYLLFRGFASRNENLATRLRRIVRGAGLSIWPNFCNNLRASCERDLLASRRFEPGDVFRWLGHSAKTAVEFYYRPSDAAFALAADEPTALHRALRTTQDRVGHDGTTMPETPRKSASGTQWPVVSNPLVGPVGFEPTTKGL